MLQQLRALLHALADSLLDCFHKCALHKLLAHVHESQDASNQPQRVIHRDTSRLTDGQIIALARTWREAQEFNKRRQKGDPPRITQEDLTKWANETFHKNKSRKTYMKIINQYLAESTVNERPYTIGIQSNTGKAGRDSNGQDTKQQPLVLPSDGSLPVRKNRKHDANLGENTR